ncbi:MAG: XrtA system polysaccharide deacetylase [Pirellulales bacterium]
MPTSIVNAFSIDVEDYFQVSAFESDVPRVAWSSFEPRVERNTRRLLALLAEQQVRATFFVLGWTAEQFPDLVREIVAAGHELGSHGYWHRLIYQQTPAAFREDIVKARAVLEEIGQVKVDVYRAPSFSITNRSLWALDELAAAGYRLDSSIFPVHHDRYGLPDAKTEPHVIRTDNGEIEEFPMAVKRFGRLNWPLSGGGYFRLLPVAVSIRYLRQINQRRGLPFVFYIHPWEIDPEQPRIAARSRAARFRHYVNLSSTERKLRRLVTEFRFTTVSEAWRSCQPTCADPAPAVSTRRPLGARLDAEAAESENLTSAWSDGLR